MERSSYNSLRNLDQKINKKPVYCASFAGMLATIILPRDARSIKVFSESSLALYFIMIYYFMNNNEP